MADTEAEQKRESVDQLEDGEKGARSDLDYVENPELERRITRKCDFHILPWIFSLWLLAFIDRSNIGQCEIRIIGSER